MEIGQIEVEGGIDNLDERIIKELRKFGEFPTNVSVVSRQITLKKGLLKAKIIYAMKERR